MSGYLTDLADVLRAAGVPVVEQDGWQTRARSSGGFADGRPWAICWHHTASAPGADPASDAAYMSYSADAKPIANILLARDGTAWVLAAGATNTEGKGGPFPVSKGTIPLDSGNTYFIGLEIQNSGVGNETYPQVQIDNAFKISIACARAYGFAINDVCIHSLAGGGWTSRKIDPATAAAVEGPWQPTSMSSSGTWSLADLLDELWNRATEAPDPPDPTPPPKESDIMATAILHVTGRNAQFIGQGPLLADGSVHNLFVTWFGPGPEGNPFLTDHGGAPDVIHQDTLASTLQRDIVLLGNPEDIQDSTGGWGPGDFYRVIRS